MRKINKQKTNEYVNKLLKELCDIAHHPRWCDGLLEECTCGLAELKFKARRYLFLSSKERNISKKEELK